MIFPSDKLNLHLVRAQQPAMFDDIGLGRNDVENSERKKQYLTSPIIVG
jgi:hypothetical protein